VSSGDSSLFDARRGIVSLGFSIVNHPMGNLSSSVKSRGKDACPATAISRIAAHHISDWRGLFVDPWTSGSVDLCDTAIDSSRISSVISVAAPLVEFVPPPRPIQNIQIDEGITRWTQKNTSSAIKQSILKLSDFSQQMSDSSEKQGKVSETVRKVPIEWALENGQASPCRINLPQSCNVTGQT
jgi:hypothetical protein